MARGHPGAASVVRWNPAMRDGSIPGMREFGDEMCRRIVAAGIPIYRGALVRSRRFIRSCTAPLTYGGEINPALRDFAANAGLTDTPVFMTSPVNEMLRRTSQPLRRRLADPDMSDGLPAHSPK